MPKTLILFAHPALEKSRVNKVLIEGVRKLKNVTFNDLYEEYPDFQIDLKREQQLLLEHDRIIWHHPLYWYSVPALMKEWFDIVLEYGWAYGAGGNALVGKQVTSVVSTGGSKEAYCAQGHNVYTIDEFLRPLERTAKLCGMHYNDPLIFFGALHYTEAELDAASATYRNLLEG